MARRREFDVDEALDAVLCVFWRKAYRGASSTELTTAAGVERPALSSAFGNTEALFRKALARSYERHLAFFPAALDKPTSREVAAHILFSSAHLHTRYPEHTGCLGIHGVLAGSGDAESVRGALIEARADGEAMLRERFERAQAEGDVPGGVQGAALAACVVAVSQGMAGQAKAGFKRETLEGVGEQALSTWPGRGAAA